MRQVAIRLRHARALGGCRDQARYGFHNIIGAGTPFILEMIQIPGADFERFIETAVNSCDVLLALIGPDWLAATDSAGGRRLDRPGDYVRLEIATALDDALAIADRKSSSSGVLERLAQDAALAQHALPDLRKLRPGETPPAELIRKT